MSITGFIFIPNTLNSNYVSQQQFTEFKSDIASNFITSNINCNTLDVDSSIVSSQVASHYVSFRGTGANNTNPYISKSYNCSLVNQSTTGAYNIGFSTPLSNSNYTILCSGSTGVFNVSQSSTGYSVKTNSQSAVSVNCAIFT